ncbi:MAG: fasciclin domain-containing protein, partial [Bacteroidales bacterium]
LGYPDNLEGLNWHNAMVIPNPEIPDELEVRTASGFIYFLDRVVPPMPSIEEYMRSNQDKFGLYYDILQRFAVYGNQRIDEQRRVLYRKSYDLVFDLAEERGPSTNTAVPPQNMWTAFLPSDQVLQNYLDNTILNYYNTIDDVPKVTLFYILQSQLSGALVLMSKLENGYFNAFGDPTEINESDIESAHMCSNGIIYETNRILEPNVFKCVPGLLFFDQEYSTLLYILNQANMLTSISNPDADVTVFATTNEKLEEYGIRYNETNQIVEARGPLDGTWKPMTTNNLTIFAQDQIYKGRISDFSGSEKYVELNSGTYIKYGNNSIVGPENIITNTPSSVQELIENELNGFLVKVDNPIMSDLVMGKILTTTEPTEPRNFADPELSEFAQLLIDARMLDPRYKNPLTKENIPNLKLLGSADYWTGFLPTNTAIAEARAQGLIPEDADSLLNFLNYHFVREDVIFDNGEKSGNFKTNMTYTDTLDNTIKYTTIKIMNSPGNLTIEDAAGRIINVDPSDANILVRKGVAHKINSVLKYFE